jgi:mono/diheme cytochrome c family protein
VNVVTGIAAVALVAVTGHYGGDLTHGETFLWEYAPGPLRALAGVAERRPAPPSVAAADPYLDVVQPMLERRCGGCHNSDKLESGFNVATYDSTLEGGDSGRAIVSGKSGSSELYRRISLPRDDEEKMPAEGKTPLTEAQVQIVRWWIDAGTPHGVTAGEVGVDASVEPLLAAELGIGGSASPAGVEVPPTVSADPALVARLYAAGFLVRQVSQTDAHMSVSVYSPGTHVGAEQVAALLSAADQIVELNLEDAGIDDAVAADLSKLTAVTHLRLSRNALTDGGVAPLASLPRLEHLNIYGNAGVTDASVDALVAAPSLRRLDVWQTGITGAGIASLRQRRPDLAVQGATDAAIVGAATAAEAAAGR